MLLLPTSAYSQAVQVTAPEEVYEGQSFVVQYELVSLDPIQRKIDLIGSGNFEQLGNPQFGYSYPSLFWGSDYYRMRVSYSLKSKIDGTIDLPQAVFYVLDQPISSAAKKIKINKLLEREEVTSFVKLEPSRSVVRVGDTLTVNYKFYTTKPIERVLDISTEPITDFYYQDLTPRRVVYTQEEIDGTIYNVYTIRKLLLQSLRQGEREFGKGKLEVEFAYPTGVKRKNHRGQLYEEYLREAQSFKIEPLTITVRNMMVI